MKKNTSAISRFQDFLETQKGQTILNYLYSWGAAVVILGTLFKLTHIAGANLMLFVGMGTEVLVFFFLFACASPQSQDEGTDKECHVNGFDHTAEI